MFSQNQKKDILLSSFEELKEDVDDSCYILAEIIAKMFAIDEDIAISMWVYLLDRHKNFVTGNLGSALCDHVILDAKDVIGMPKLIEIIASNDIIKCSTFKLSGHIFIGAIKVITECIVNRDFSNANDFLELYSQNKNNKPDNVSLTDILLEAADKVGRNNQSGKMDYSSSVFRAKMQGIQAKLLEKDFDDEIDFLFKWSERVKNSTDAAKIKEAILKINK